MKIIATVPVRNEAWILPVFLRAMDTIADAILVVDQASTDATPVICRQFAKVIAIHNSSPQYDEAARSQLLLDAARQFDGNNLIITLDADELFSADVLGSAIERLAESLRPGESGELQWIWLWKSPRVFRYDRVAFGANWKPFVFRDDRCSRFEAGVIHQERAPGRIALSRKRFAQPKVLHYQFVDWARALAKQRWYRCLERVMFPAKDPYATNVLYSWFLAGSRQPDLRRVPAEWIDPWRARGVDVDAYTREHLFWYDLEILRMFRQLGAERFADLDIWDVDWEERRQAAMRAGYLEIPETPIRDPRSTEQRVAQLFTRRTLHVPPWRAVTRLPGSLNAQLRSSPRGS
jgi:glycosyltransferase involved in cell wall biosynthesis